MTVLLRALLPEDGGRKTAIFDGYRPTWRSDRKPEHNDASVVLTDTDARIRPGDEGRAVLLPHRPDLWIDRVQVGDVLRGHEGQRVVAEAAVLGVEVSPDGGQA